jgi:hypothetical protein
LDKDGDRAVILGQGSGDDSRPANAMAEQSGVPGFAGESTGMERHNSKPWADFEGLFPWVLHHKFMYSIC